MQQRIAFVTKTTSVALCEEPFIHKTSISRWLFEAQYLVGNPRNGKFRQNILFYISVVMRPYIYRANISPKLKSLKYYIYGSIYAACRYEFKYWPIYSFIFRIKSSIPLLTKNLKPYHMDHMKTALVRSPKGNCGAQRTRWHHKAYLKPKG